ncbi:hypothetical protein PWT90_02087 [Aphanocladium album]|nr:hypothetical protein PWT90_02087 [Aphanocladium album]
MSEARLSPVQGVRAGHSRASMAPHRIFLSGVSAGCLLAFACGTALVTSTSPWMQENTPCLVRILASLVFPYGLVLIMLTGVDLCTASFMVLFFSFLLSSNSFERSEANNESFIDYDAGDAAATDPLGGRCFGTGPSPFSATWRARCSSSTSCSATATCLGPSRTGPRSSPTRTRSRWAPAWHQIFLRGVGCNWMVCLAVYLGVQGQSVASKTVGKWWPVFGFVSLGFDHTVANMTFVPMGIALGTPGLSVGLYIWKGIIPVVLGNIVGGGLFCGKCYLVPGPEPEPGPASVSMCMHLFLGLFLSLLAFYSAVPGLVPERVPVCAYVPGWKLCLCLDFG